MNLLTINDLSKTYTVGEIEVPALKKITLEIEENRFISFIGPSGSGKTTLLNMIGCLDKPTTGEVTINGTLLNRLDRKAAAEFRGANLGFIFQNFNLIPVLTVYENVEYPLVMVEKLPAVERCSRVMNLLERVRMVEKKDLLPNQISGGQKQRVAIARSLVLFPKIVLADEPTANLDRETTYRIINVMHEMKQEFGTTFIFSTHDPKIVGEAEIIYTLEDGAIADVKKVS